MKKILFSSLVFLFFYAAAGAQSKVYEFRNGNWFNGTDFVNGTWYVQNKTLTQKVPAKVDSLIDLDGRFVIPPMGDASSASIADNPSADYTIKSYHNEGIFYVQILSNTQEGRKAIAPMLNKASSVDATFGNGSITCTLGEPFLRYEGPAQNMRNPQVMADRYEQLKLNRAMLGDGYWFIDNKDALNANWKKLTEQKPDFVTIYLLDAANSGGKEGKGLTPDVAKMVIKNAHRSKLRVYAAIENAADVQLALKLGVDGLANLPGKNWDGKTDKSKYDISTDDLKRMAKKDVVVIPLFSHALGGPLSSDLQAYQSDLMTRMLANNVQVAIGSNDPQRTTRSELNYWFQFGSLNAQQALKILCENTPQAIFPKRKIGRIADGYEASFVVLSDNPMGNLLKVRAISFLVKDGMVMKAE